MQYKEIIRLLNERAVRLSNDARPNARFRAAHYKRAADVVAKGCRDSDIVSAAAVNKLPITDYMKEKIMALSRGESPKPVAADDLLRDLSENYAGLGAAKAKILIADGLRSTADLLKKKWFDRLPIETQTFLKLRPESPIKHEDIKVIDKLITAIAGRPHGTNLVEIIIVGSYRRKKAQSNDIDVMVVSKKKNVLDDLVAAIKEKIPVRSKRANLVVKDNAVTVYSKGDDKQSIVISIGPRAFKLDLFRCTPEDRIPMLLYSTGSKENNVMMRGAAKRQGYLLNQKGLFERETGRKIAGLKTEKSFYDKLGLPYKTPEER